MEIDESSILDPEYYDEINALACLLAGGVCFLNVAKFSVGTYETETTCIFVNCNDLFAWGGSDAESILNNDGEEGSEIIELYKLWKENSKWGVYKWVCIKRNQKPQFPIERDMKADGYWDDVMENLRANDYWKEK